MLNELCGLLGHIDKNVHDDENDGDDYFLRFGDGEYARTKPKPMNNREYYRGTCVLLYIYLFIDLVSSPYIESCDRSLTPIYIYIFICAQRKHNAETMNDSNSENTNDARSRKTLADDAAAAAAPLFKHPFTAIVSGSTGSGKTEWMMRLLRNLDALCGVGRIRAVLYCYGELNERVLELQTLTSGHAESGAITFAIHAGTPSEEFVQTAAARCDSRLLLVLDDLMVGIRQSLLDTVFTRGSHNWGVSVVLVTQHLFAKEMRVARANAHYLVLMRNPAGELQVRTLGAQLFPRRGAYFHEAYTDATREQFSYLVVDMHPTTDDRLRLKTNIYPSERPLVVYVPRQ